MFNPTSYRKSCDRLRLDRDRMEEMIQMTEQNKSGKRFGRPARMALVAAALVAAMGITAGAASIPAVQEIFSQVRVTFLSAENGEGGDVVITLINMPELSIQRQEDDTIILTVEVDDNDVREYDITSALTQEGHFETRIDKADGYYTVEVEGDGEDWSYLITAYDAQGEKAGSLGMGKAEMESLGAGELVSQFDFSDGELASEGEYTVNYEVSVDTPEGQDVEITDNVKVGVVTAGEQDVAVSIVPYTVISD